MEGLLAYQPPPRWTGRKKWGPDAWTGEKKREITGSRARQPFAPTFSNFLIAAMGAEPCCMAIGHSSQLSADRAGHVSEKTAELGRPQLATGNVEIRLEARRIMRQASLLAAGLGFWDDWRAIEPFPRTILSFHFHNPA